MRYRPMKIDDQSDLLMDFGFKRHSNRFLEPTVGYDTGIITVKMYQKINHVEF